MKNNTDSGLKTRVPKLSTQSNRLPSGYSLYPSTIPIIAQSIPDSGGRYSKDFLRLLSDGGFNTACGFIHTDDLEWNWNTLSVQELRDKMTDVVQSLRNCRELHDEEKRSIKIILRQWCPAPAKGSGTELNWSGWAKHWKYVVKAFFDNPFMAGFQLADEPGAIRFPNINLAEQQIMTLQNDDMLVDENGVNSFNPDIIPPRFINLMGAGASVPSLILGDGVDEDKMKAYLVKLKKRIDDGGYYEEHKKEFIEDAPGRTQELLKEYNALTERWKYLKSYITADTCNEETNINSSDCPNRYQHYLDYFEKELSLPVISFDDYGLSITGAEYYGKSLSEVLNLIESGKKFTVQYGGLNAYLSSYYLASQQSRKHNQDFYSTILCRQVIVFDSSGDKKVTYMRPEPTRVTMGIQALVGILFGARGLTYWGMGNNTGSGNELYRNNPLDEDNQPTEVFNDIRQINEVVKQTVDFFKDSNYYGSYYINTPDGLDTYGITVIPQFPFSKNFIQSYAISQWIKKSDSSTSGEPLKIGEGLLITEAGSFSSRRFAILNLSTSEIYKLSMQFSRNVKCRHFQLDISKESDYEIKSPNSGSSFPVIGRFELNPGDLILLS